MTSLNFRQHEILLIARQAGKVTVDGLAEHFKVSLIFENLPPGVLGYTEFGPKGVEAVHIGEPADRTKSAERRVNSTIAHEGGHGLMHAHLFALGDDVESLFSNDSDISKTRVLCRDGETETPVVRERRYDGRWWEVQADKAIGALLLPKRAFLAFMEPFLERRGTFGSVVLPSDHRARASANPGNSWIARKRRASFTTAPCAVRRCTNSGTPGARKFSSSRRVVRIS